MFRRGVSGAMLRPLSRLSSTFAESSTPDIRLEPLETGVAYMSPIPAAVAPASTYLPLKMLSGAVPSSTSTYDTRGGNGSRRSA